MKNRTILGIICIALSVALVFGISPLISMISSEKIEVIQLNKNIRDGSQITQNDIVTVEVGKLGAPENVITNADAVVGKYATTNLYPNINLIPAMLTADSSNADTVLKGLDSNHLAISITVPSFAAALSAKLENGDIVSVVASTADDTFIPRELTYVRVITTTTADGVDRDDIDQLEEGEENLPSTITLLATPQQAKLLAEYEVKADMHLALVSRGDEAAAEEYLAMQTEILAQIRAEEEADSEEFGEIVNEPVPAETTGPEEDGGDDNE